MTRLIAADERGIGEAAEALRRGLLVAFPTETVYGLGGRADDPSAVAGIFEAKGRPRFDPLIVHVPSLGTAEEVALLDDRARALALRFWPGPLTLVLPRRPWVPDLVCAGLPTVAVRIPSHPVALSLLERAGVPVAAPSANRFGRVSPTSAEDVLEELRGRVDLVLDGGRTPIGVESTVLDLSGERPLLLRPGGIPLEELREILPDVALGDAASRLKAPGGLKKHYAPSCEVLLFSGEVPPPPREGCALLLVFPREGTGGLGYPRVLVLSPRGDLREAASNLFRALRELEREHELIVAELPPEEGLGLAIADRLRRASARG